MPSRKLTSVEVAQIKADLKSSLRGYWQAGCVINEAFGDKKQYGTGLLAKIQTQLGRMASISTLDQCRRLAKHWGSEDIKAAEQADLPIRHAISLLFFDAHAKKLDQTLKSNAAKAMIEKRKALVVRYKKENWDSPAIVKEIQEAKASCFREMKPGAQRKRVDDVKRSVLSNLKRASQRLRDSKGLLTSNEYSKAGAIAVKIDELIERTSKIANG